MDADRLAHTNELLKEPYILKFPEFIQYKTAILMIESIMMLQHKFVVVINERE